MSLKKTLILLAIGSLAVAALAVYVLVIDPKFATSEQALKERTLVFPYTDPTGKNRTLADDATRIRIQRGDTVVLLVKTDSGRWRLREPLDARAALAAIRDLRYGASGLLDILAHLRIRRIIQPQAGHQETQDPYGFDARRLAVSFWLGDEEHKFRVGKNIRGYTCIQVDGEPRVLVVARAAIARFDREPNGFRDHRVLGQLARNSLRSLTLATPKKTLTFRRSAKQWAIVSPVTDSAKSGRLNALVDGMRGLAVQEFVDDQPRAIADYGLDPERLRLVLTLDSGESSTLRIGKECKHNARLLYAKREDEPFVFAIGKKLIEGIDPELASLRQREVARVDPKEVAAVVITRNEAVCALERGPGSTGWRLTRPKPARAEARAIRRFLADLGRIRVAQWIDDPKDEAHGRLEKPAATITIERTSAAPSRGQKPAPVTLHISPPVKRGKELGRYIRRGGQACLLFVSAGPLDAAPAAHETLSTQALKRITYDLTKGYARFLDHGIFRFERSDAVKLVIRRAATEVVCQRDGETWKVASPAGLEADAASIAAILGAMADLRAQECVADAPADLTPYALDAPELTLAASIRASPPAPGRPRQPGVRTRTLHLSRDVGGRTYARSPDSPLVFVLKPKDARTLRAEPVPTAIAAFSRYAVAALSIARRGQPPIVLARQGDTWRITAPRQAEALRAPITKAIAALQGLEAVRYLDYDANDLGRYALAPPEIAITLKLKGKPDFVLHVGKPVPDEHAPPGFYARRAASQLVFLMAKDKAQLVAPTLADLEKKPGSKDGDAKQPRREEPAPKAAPATQ